MKKLVLLSVFLLMFVIPVLSEAAVASWQQAMLNVDGSLLTDLSGWNFYEVTSGRVKLNSSLIPISSCTGSTTLSCTWTIPSGAAIKGDKFVITAVDATGAESADSNIATYTIKPKAPSLLLVQ